MTPTEKALSMRTMTAVVVMFVVAIAAAGAKVEMEEVAISAAKPFMQS
jgi:hypothetical protein